MRGAHLHRRRLRGHDSQNLALIILLRLQKSTCLQQIAGASWGRIRPAKKTASHSRRRSRLHGGRGWGRSWPARKATTQSRRRGRMCGGTGWGRSWPARESTTQSRRSGARSKAKPSIATAQRKTRRLSITESQLRTAPRYATIWGSVSPGAEE